MYNTDAHGLFNVLIHSIRLFSFQNFTRIVLVKIAISVKFCGSTA